MPCDSYSIPLPHGSPPSLNANHPRPDDWTPYTSWAQFKLVELLYAKSQMSAGGIDQLMKICAAHGAEQGETPPFIDHKDLYKSIDATPLANIPWQSFVTSYNGEIPQEGKVPSWMTAEHTVWFWDPCLLIHSMLSNPNFRDTFDMLPYQEYDTNGNHWYCNFMSASYPVLRQ